MVSSRKTAAASAAAAVSRSLLLAERLAVCALIHSRVSLMGTYQDLVQGAVVLRLAMVGALLDSTFNTLVCVTVHRFNLL